MIPPAVLAQFGSLELVARAVVDGVLHGAHMTDRPGFSQEFAEYRDYVPGDDPGSSTGTPTPGPTGRY